MTRFINSTVNEDLKIGDTISIVSQLDSREAEISTRIIGKKNNMLLLKDSYVGRIKTIKKTTMQ